VTGAHAGRSARIAEPDLIAALERDRDIDSSKHAKLVEAELGCACCLRIWLALILPTRLTSKAQRKTR
jgi:hypothetical protein